MVSGLRNEEKQLRFCQHFLRNFSAAIAEVIAFLHSSLRKSIDVACVNALSTCWLAKFLKSFKKENKSDKIICVFQVLFNIFFSNFAIEAVLKISRRE